MEVDLESKVHESQEPMNSDQYAGGKNIESAAESGERMLEDKEAAQIPIDISKADDAFYVRYYSGHQGKYGHEFLEFDLRAQANGRFATLRYANNSNYRNDTLIKKEAMLSPSVIKEFKKIIADSEILKEDDERWPQKNRDGKQELEVRVGKYHISFETAKIGSLNDVQNSDDPEGLRVFYYLVQDLKAFVFSLISLHFKIKPI